MFPSISEHWFSICPSGLYFIRKCSLVYMCPRRSPTKLGAPAPALPAEGQSHVQPEGRQVRAGTRRLWPGESGVKAALCPEGPGGWG